SPPPRRVLGAQRAGAGPTRGVPRRLHHGAWRGSGAAARPGGGRTRLPGEADQLARGAREDPPLGGEVTSRQFLIILVAVQAALLVALVILLLLNRSIQQPPRPL